MSTQATEGTMLIHRGTQVPAAGDFHELEMSIGLALEPTQFLELALAGLKEQGQTLPLSEEQAWRLTYFARNIGLDGEQLLARAKKIESLVVDWHYGESR